VAVSTGFRAPVGNGNVTEANDGDGYYVATNFDWFNPDFNAYHLGEDWNGEGGGNTDLGDPVYAISNGTVVERGVDDAFGNYLIIRHDLPTAITVDGITTSTVYSLYGHFQNPSLVHVGDVVSMGQQIGNIGYTGMADGNAHVHLEIRLGYGAGYTNMDGYSFTPSPAGWVDPTDFINAYRNIGTGPTLTSVTPADDSTVVPANSNLVLTFNETVAAGTGNVVIYNADGTVARQIAITDTSQITFSGNTVTINPTADLAANSAYYVNIASTAIHDSAGHNYTGLIGNTALNFTTIASDLAGNTLATARAVTVGSTQTTYHDFVGPTDTLDFYKFTTTDVSHFVLSLTGLTADADVYLLNSQGIEVAHSYNAGTTPEAIDIASLGAGTYYVRVNPYSSASTDYNLNLTATPPAPDGAGNTLATARAITVGSTQSTYHDNVGPSDTVDYYKFTTTAAGHFMLSLTGLTADADVYLLNAQGSEVAHSYNSGSTPEAIDVASLAAGTYYLQVKPYNGASTDYTLGVSATVPDTPPPDMAGNTLATARAITVGGTPTTYHDYVGPTDTFDYYKFTTTGTTHLSMSLTGLAADADLYLLNSKGAQVAHNYNGGATPEAIDVANLSAGTYYVEVHSFNNAATSYDLMI
jgi:methionine-rich copper-binding protein CopC